jgi:hypothetical protein
LAGTTESVAQRGLPVPAAAARPLEEHVLQRLPAITGKQALRRVVVLDAAALHDDDALA